MAKFCGVPVCVMLPILARAPLAFNAFKFFAIFPAESAISTWPVILDRLDKKRLTVIVVAAKVPVRFTFKTTAGLATKLAPSLSSGGLSNGLGAPPLAKSIDSP